MERAAADGLLALALRVEQVIVTEASAPEVAELARRSDEIGAAVELFLDAGDSAAALNLVGALSVFWQDAGRVEEGRHLTSAVLARTEGAPADVERARALLVLGQLAFRQGDQSAAADATTAAGLMARKLGDTVLEAKAELNLARVAFRDGDADRIFAHARKVQAVAGDNLRLRSGAIHMLGWAHYTAGDIAAAMRHFEENVALYREAGNHLDCASELANLGDLAAETGDLEAGARYLRNALEVPGVAASSYLAPALVRSAGVIAAQRGNAAAAIALFAAADRFYTEAGLIADPGDDVSEEVLATAMASMDETSTTRALQLASGWSLDDAVGAAAEALR